MRRNHFHIICNYWNKVTCLSSKGITIVAIQWLAASMTLMVGHPLFWEKSSGFHLHGTSRYIVHSYLYNVSIALPFVKKKVFYLFSGFDTHCRFLWIFGKSLLGHFYNLLCVSFIIPEKGSNISWNFFLIFNKFWYLYLLLTLQHTFNISICFEFNCLHVL